MQSPRASSFTFTLFLTTNKNNLFFLPLLLLLHVLFIMVVSADHEGDGFSESESFFSFIRAIDPQNVLHIDGSSSSNPCMMKSLRGTVRCDSEGTNIVEIRLENLNLSGTIDAESLCRLEKLRLLSLVQNKITGNVPNSILHCARLSYLNLSNNHLCGSMPIRGLLMKKLKFLRKFDISNNNFPVLMSHHHHHGEGGIMQLMADPPAVTTITTVHNNQEEGDEFSILYVLVIGIMLMFLGFYFASVQVSKKSSADNNQFHIRKATSEDEFKEEEEAEEMKNLKKIRNF